jgi:hypothetical protein
MNGKRKATIQFVVICALLVSGSMVALGMKAVYINRHAASEGQLMSPKCVPPFPKSSLITKVVFDKYRFHKGDGDTWPLTWASDGNLYGAAGDNMGSPMNFWKIIGAPGGEWWVELIDKLPIDPAAYCQRPNIDHKNGVKPGGVLSINGKLYFAVENMNYGDNPKFNRQHNVNAWIVTSTDFGKTWNRSATPQDFFTGRLGSPHFLQFGKDYEGARDGYVYVFFAAGDDGNAYWENNDYILLGRVAKDRMLNRTAWEFFTGTGASGEPNWNKDDKLAEPVFRYPLMTGEDHVSYDRGIKRYLLGNYGFMDEGGNPRPYHQLTWPTSVYPSQLTLYEATEPWGPWTLFYRDDNWGTYGDYNPSFPTKWMSEDGKTLWMVSAGTFDDYCFTVQKLTLVLGN